MLACGLIVAAQAHAANIVVNNLDAGTGLGFDDPTPVTPVTGNPATTLGAQRLAAFQAAADQWAAILQSPVTIVIDAEMVSKSCTQNSAVLGSAGPSGYIFRDFENAPAAETWYPQALRNALVGTDGDPGAADLSASFNKDIGQSGCLASLGWSYVIGAPNPSGTLAFTDTVLHEIGHGLGFLTFVSMSSGSQLQGYSDHYSRFLIDETPSPTLWDNLTNAGRLASATDTGNLTWSGPEVANVAGIITTGLHGTSGRVRMYAPNPIQGGSSVSHWDSALDPNEIMEPSATQNNRQLLTNHLMLDIGWKAMTALDLTMTDGQASTTSGSSISYTGTVTNNGPGDLTVVGAAVTSGSPSGLTGQSWTCSTSGGGSCGSTSGSGAINTTLTLPLGAVATLTVDATVSGSFSGTLTNPLTVTMPSNIANTSPSSASDNTTVSEGGGGSAGITVSSISGDTSETGGTASFTMVLDAEPTGSVTIDVSSSDLTEGTVSPASVTFTASDWSTPKAVTVTGVDDQIDDDNVGFVVVTDPASGGDPYSGINPSNVTVFNQDNDTAGISVSSVSGTTSESGGSATFSVVLETQPTQPVTIDLVSDNASEGLPSPASLTFDSSNWDTPRTVTVTGQDDDVDDGTTAYSIVTNPAISSDGKYSGMNAANVTVSNSDNDTADISVSSISGPTSEAGRTATFTIVLETEPLADVTIDVRSDDTSEGTVSPASVTFTPGNWNTAKVVTVTGQPDAVSDGTVAYNIITDPAQSSDSKYDNMNAANVTVNNEEEVDEIFNSSFD